MVLKSLKKLERNIYYIEIIMTKLSPFHLAIPVQNLSESKDFYENVLGCKRGRESEEWADYDFFGHQLVIHVDPNHKGINEYLGELYVATNRHNLAVERLEVLKSCNCQEYEELKAIIAGEKISKY